LILDIYSVVGSLAAGHVIAPASSAERSRSVLPQPAGERVVAVVALAWTGNMSTPEGGLPIAPRSAVLSRVHSWKTVLPVGLSPLYELPARISPLAAVRLSAAVVAFLTGVAVAVRRRWPALTAAWASYVVILLPVIGIVHNGHQIAADRYTYLATIGWAMLIAGALVSAARRVGAGRRLAPVVTVIPSICLVLLVALTWMQSRLWQTSYALWTHAMSVTPASAPVHVAYGVMLASQGKLAEALTFFERALALRPDLTLAHFNMALTLHRLGRMAGAIQHFERARAEPQRRIRAHEPGHRAAAAGTLVRRRRALLPALPDPDKRKPITAWPPPCVVSAIPRTLSVTGTRPAARPDYDAALHNLGTPCFVRTRR
jgi:hypothetical protein